MNDDAIDQILGAKSEIDPSPDFAHRVMRSVRHEAADRQAITFPWGLLAAGLVIAAVLALVGVLTGSMPSDAALARLPAGLPPALGWLSTTLVACLGLTWWSLRFARR